MVNYTDHNVPYTRIIEHKHFNDRGTQNTVLTKEYPIECQRNDTPYYPIGDDHNLIKYQKYKKLADSCTNVIFGGRLAEYRYYDMHQVVGSALIRSQKELN